MGSRRLSAMAPQTDTLRWGVGSLSSLIGAMMLITPSQFRSAIYSVLQPDLQVWGIAFLAVGVGLIGLIVFRPSRPITLLVHIAGGVECLLLAYSLGLVQGWTGTANFACLGLGTLAAPFLDRSAHSLASKHSRRDDPDLLPLTIGCGSALTGVTILAFPEQFGSSTYDVIRSYLPLLGIAFLIGGLLLVYVHSNRSASRGLRIAAHLAGGGALLTFFAVSSVPLRAWIGMAYYGGFGLGIALHPWVGSPADRVDSTTLQSRLAYSLAVIASIPLILAIALVQELTTRTVGPSPQIDQARDLAFLVLLVTTIVGAYLGVTISRRLARPLRGLAVAADELARGHEAAPLPVSRVAEVDSLSRAFGEMREQLAARASERERLLALVSEQATRAEQRAAELDAVLDSIADGLVIYDRQGDAVRLNPAAERILGYSRGDLAGDLRARSDRVGPRRADGQAFASEEHPVGRALAGETTRSVTMLFHPRSGGVVWASVSAAAITTEDGTITGAVMTFSDVTAQHQLEQAREEFLSLVSHDLRNPLTALQGHAQLLRRQLASTGLKSEAMLVDAILRSSDRMSAMIRDLVESARLESGRLPLTRRPTDLGALIADVVARVPTESERRRVRVEIPGELPPVAADAERVERLLDNLIGNALKYAAAPSPVVVRAAASGREVVVSVADEGPGIPAADLPHVFDKYYRARSEVQVDGLGLGLYISRLIAEAHGGRIWVESKVGNGSTFAFALPFE